MDDVGIQLLIHVVFAVIVGAVAQSKGRNVVGWAALGLIVPCIGLILVLVLPDLKVEERRRVSAQAERRRLREELRQERMKTEAYRRHVSARLDAHDDHLGIDTRTTPALSEGHGVHAPAAHLVSGGDPAAGVGAPTRAPIESGPKEWYYERGGESRGPVSDGAIRMGLQKGRIDAATLVWREGMPTWQAVSEVTHFRSEFRS